MKRTKILLPAIFILSLGSYFGCKKYESNAYFIQLQTVKSRLCGKDWTLDNDNVRYFSKNDSISSYDTRNCIMSFEKDGTFKYTNEKTAYEYSVFFEDGLKGEGNWAFEEKKQLILLDFGNRTMTFHIVSLHFKQLWMYHLLPNDTGGEYFQFSKSK